MMYKILLVDDEPMVLKSLKATIDWENYGFEVVDCAISASEALEKIEKKKPDVVFTDVRMPEISGLELLQMMKRAYPEIICVIISGYAEFAYVQKAIKLEAVGYCLKPFDYDEIVLYLKKIRKSLEEKQSYDSEKTRVLECLESRKPEAAEYLKNYFVKKKISFQKENIKAVYMLCPAFEEQAEYLLKLKAGTGKMIYFMHEEQIQNFFAGRPETCKAGVSDRIKNVESAGNAVQEARKRAYQFFCQPEMKICNAIPEDRGIRSVFEFFVEIQKKDQRAVESRVQELKKEFQKGHYSIEACVLLKNLMETTAEKKEEKEKSAFLWDYDDLCSEYENADELLDELKLELRLRSGEEEELKKIPNQTFLEIKNYIETNFAEHITAADIAQKFHVNACYLSHLFKKETGRTFTGFLTETRIEFACRQLKEGTETIAQIAEQSGFTDYFYFSKVFRKVMQCTPSEYRAE